MASSSTPGRARYRIGRYLITARIGKGGMGMVYLGRDEALERDVAVKTLTAEGSLDAESRQRFEVEARAAARLQHPNIVTVHELGEDRSIPYIAMELLPGADLESLLRGGGDLLLTEKLDIVVQVCRGLDYAHERGVVHRDIKPSNVRLLDDGTAKIMDFGIAKLGSTHLTRTGMMVGTLHYMSPEQAQGRPLDGRSDIFSLGVILYELLAGEKPFRGEGPTILYKIVHEPPPRLDAVALGLDPRLADVVARALNKDPEQRYPRAGAMADEVLAVLDGVRRSTATPAPGAPLDDARRLLREGRVEEGLTRLRALVEGAPTSVEVRRVLRAATRESKRRPLAGDAAPDAFPELEATYRAAQTSSPAETQVPPPTVAQDIPPTRVLAEPPPAASSSARLLAVPAVLLLVGLGLGFLLLRGRGTPSPGPSPEAAVPSAEEAKPSPVPAEEPAERTPAAPAPVLIPVITDPPGSSVSLDGKPVKGTTPLDVSLVPGQDHRVSVGLEGWAAQEVLLTAGRYPTEIRLRLEPAGPLATVTLVSSYPLDVSWRGRALARGATSPRVQVPGGRQVLVLAAPSVFLRGEIVVNVAPGGTASVEAPALGRLSIRAHPDNCRVSIDGTFVDYSPIRDKPAAAGAHAVTFEWPDGVRAQEAVEVPVGKVAFVTGRKP